MQARSVIIQDNWQVVPLYKKSWWSMGGEAQLRRRSCLVVTSMKNTGETTRSSALSIHSFKNFESTCNSPLIFFPFVGFSKNFSSKVGIWLTPFKRLTLFTSQIRKAK